MNNKTYNTGLLLGTLQMVSGAAWIWGTGVALLTGGALLIALTLFGALLSKKG
ncbi:MAG: hypothetical protein H7293_04790 [Candidatus Saccharibacteria bacterium]|nr:hypothetical protein [Rhodoferax sp.]